MRASSCAAIVADFYWGPLRCGKPAVTTVWDWREWPVCAEHAPPTQLLAHLDGEPTHDRERQEANG